MISTGINLNNFKGARLGRQVSSFFRGEQLFVPLVFAWGWWGPVPHPIIQSNNA